MSKLENERSLDLSEKEESKASAESLANGAQELSSQMKSDVDGEKAIDQYLKYDEQPW
jgi:hypothetical protein